MATFFAFMTASLLSTLIGTYRGVAEQGVSMAKPVLVHVMHYSWVLYEPYASNMAETFSPRMASVPSLKEHCSDPSPPA